MQPTNIPDVGIGSLYTYAYILEPNAPQGLWIYQRKWKTRTKVSNYCVRLGLKWIIISSTNIHNLKSIK